jgi:hypothetical protein
MFLVENEDIFAFTDHPDAATYLDQGLSTVLLNPLAAAWDNLLTVIALPAFPVGLVGLIALVGLWRAPVTRRPTALMALLLSGALTVVSTMLLFPVATLWGTFMHSSGPLLVALGVLAALGGDALLARISAWRDWERANIIVAPVALVSMAALFTVFQVRVFSDQSLAAEARYAQLADSLVAVAEAGGGELPETLITDHPMWLADATGGYAIALPDEDIDALTELSGLFEAPWVVVVGERGRYPETLLEVSAQACLTADPVPIEAAGTKAWLFQLADGCDAT